MSRLLVILANLALRTAAPIGVSGRPTGRRSRAMGGNMPAANLGRWARSSSARGSGATFAVATLLCKNRKREK